MDPGRVRSARFLAPWILLTSLPRITGTVVALISRWYELGSADTVSNYLRNGEIKIGSHTLSTIDLRWWRAQIGLVQQDPFLFNDTILKNVEYGLVGTEYESAASEVKVRLVQQACKDAFADDFIRKLPEVPNLQYKEKRSMLSDTGL